MFSGTNSTVNPDVQDSKHARMFKIITFNKIKPKSRDLNILEYAIKFSASHK